MWSVGVIFFQCLYGKKVSLNFVRDGKLVTHSFSVQPFGHNLTQANILEQNTILHAKEVSFPVKPPVTQEAKVDTLVLHKSSYILLYIVPISLPLSLSPSQSFIRRCLSYSKDERPDVLALCQDAYIQPSSRKAPGPRPTSPAAMATTSNSSNFTGLFS